MWHKSLLINKLAKMKCPVTHLTYGKTRKMKNSGKHR